MNTMHLPQAPASNIIPPNIDKVTDLPCRFFRVLESFWCTVLGGFLGFLKETMKQKKESAEIC